jgi:hypothetical protein
MVKPSKYPIAYRMIRLMSEKQKPSWLTPNASIARSYLSSRWMKKKRLTSMAISSKLYHFGRCY